MKKLFTLSILVGCGANPIPVDNINTFSVESATDLPTCDETRTGQLYFLEKEQQFQTCKTSGWVVVEIKGATGVAGASGTTVSAEFYCSKLATRNFAYQSITYSTGDKLIMCSVDLSTATATNVIFYKSTMAGAAISSCLVSADLDTPTSGWWAFSETSGVRKTVYSDSSSGSNGTTVTFATNDCDTY